MKSPVLLAMLALGCLTAIADRAFAQDKTLSEGHPVNLGDAFFVGPGDGTVLGTASVVVPRQSRSLGVLPTGQGSRAVDLELKGYATKSLVACVGAVLIWGSVSSPARTREVEPNQDGLEKAREVPPSRTVC